MLSATQINLLVLGMVALQNAASQISDAATVTEAYNARYHHVLKEIVSLEACGFLVSQDRCTPVMIKSRSYALTLLGEQFLKDNKELYMRTHFSVLLGERKVVQLN